MRGRVSETTSLQIFLFLGPRGDEPARNTDSDTLFLVKTSAMGAEMEDTPPQHGLEAEGSLSVIR